MNRHLSISCVLCALAFASADARADEPVSEETIFVIDAPPDRGAVDRERRGGVARHRAPSRGSIPAMSSVADAIATSAGATCSSLGGLGAYQTVSVRGATPGHTAVLIDGVPLAKLAAVTVDLGRFPLDAFGEVRFYRGAVPVELGGAGIGGAVNLVTRLGRGPHGERLSASLGVGSYGARHFRAHWGDEHGESGEVLSSTTIGYQGATGDYSYYDDNGTLLNPRDDGYKQRANNGFDQLDAATRFATRERPAGALAGGLRLSFKREGLPGSTAAPAPTAKLATFDGVADAKLVTPVGGWAATQLAYALVEIQRLTDRAGELGLGDAERAYSTVSLGATSTWQRGLGAHRLSLAGELRADLFTDRDARMGTEAVSGSRTGGAATASIDLALAPQLVVTPAFRIDALHSAPTPVSVGPTAGMDVPSRWDVVPSPRLTALVSVTPDLAIKGSAGLYARLPTLLEVFGNRGFILGNPDLEPERGPSTDLGFVWAPARAQAEGKIDRILVQADVFANRAHDTIALLTYAGYVTKAANIGDTQAYGAEVIASARLEQTLSVTASYTRLVTEQISSDVSVDGKPVPRRPGHALYARADLERRLWDRTAAVWIDAAYQAQSFLDPASLGTTPRRLLVGTGARIEVIPRLGLALAVANVADRRIAYLPLDPGARPSPTPLTDVAGFPLPGRSFYVSVDWTH